MLLTLQQGVNIILIRLLVIYYKLCLFIDQRNKQNALLKSLPESLPKSRSYWHKDLCSSLVRGVNHLIIPYCWNNNRFCCLTDSPAVLSAEIIFTWLVVFFFSLNI